MTTCAKCGSENVAGDAFCGNCGAFLEFAAEEAAETTQSDPESAAPGPFAGAVDEGPAGPHPAAAPGAPSDTAALPTAAPGAPAPGANGATCAACGRVNPVGRRFCISCGELLPSGAAAAGRPATPPRGGFTAAGLGAAAAGTTGGGAPSAAGAPPAPPTGPAKPAWDFPTAPVPVAAPGPSKDPVSRADGAGRSRLPLIIVALVVLVAVVGGAFVVLGGGLGGGTPAPSASAAPSTALSSATPGPGPSGEPASPEPSSQPTVAPTAAPATIPPGPAVGIKIKGAKASSQLSSKRSVKNLYDGSPASAWKSASGKYEGSWIQVSFAPTAVTRLLIWSGWQIDEPFFYGNYRPRNVTVAFDGGDPVPLQLKDILGAQKVDIPPELGITRATRVRITILDSYPARRTSASGSPTDQVAVSEIRIFGVPVTP